MKKDAAPIRGFRLLCRIGAPLAVACALVLVGCSQQGTASGSQAGTSTTSALSTDPPSSVTPAPPPAMPSAPPPATAPAPAASTYVPAPVGTGGTIDIDQAWLNQQGASPYYLTQADMTYVLQTDVSTPGTAFIVLAPKVAFDLNGHTVTYDNEPPISVPNGSFEQGANPGDVPGWNLVDAPGAVRAPVLVDMWGSWALEIPNIAAAETIASSPIAIPQANARYAALITPKATTSAGAGVTLAVVDTVTGATLASQASPSPSTGFSPVVLFTPTTTDPVQLLVTVTPPASGQPANVYLDNATVSRTGSYGVVATHSPWFLPPQLQTSAINAGASSVADVLVKNGTIIQGGGGSYAASAVFGKSTTGITVDHVNATASGDDTDILELMYATNPVVINSTLTGQLSRISDRMNLYSAIQLAGAKGPVLIAGNTISGTLDTGILMARSGTVTDPITISGNTITQNTLVADGYGIVLDNVENFTVANNILDPVNGRGLMLDTYASGVTLNGQVYGNVIHAQEHPNLEYSTVTGQSVVGMELRVFTGGRVKNVTFSHNTFAAQTGVGNNWAALGARIYIASNNVLMANSDLVFENNDFQAVADSIDPNLAGSAQPTSAFGVSLSQVPPGTGIQFLDNNFESNNISLNLGDDYGYNGTITGVLFLGNTITKLDQGAAMPYQGILVNHWKVTSSNVALINTNYADTAATSPGFLDVPLPSDLETGWQLDLTVLDSGGSPASGVSVRVLNAAGEPVYAGATDVNGKLAAIPVVTTEYQKAAGTGTPVTTTGLGPFTVTVSDGGAQQSFAMGQLTANAARTIQLH